ncbi:DUF3105 domain-containing protein [Segeticoccus rhizosphaerae]|uniref:DUF3105 domain-containing protein n=1 Tax=Segeticoccus rhizosphaerae TaxID=1104777 RepID=UPI0010C0D5D7|nr:DUF3105 domain-containing protein [Ornithinicoccus soli]
MSRSKRSRNNESTRTERLAQVRRAQARQERRRKIAIWGGTATALVLIAAVVAFSIIREQANQPTLAAVQTYQEQRGHVTTPVDYAQTPPAGGEHAPVWLNCGVYDQPVPNENAVHALEHGAVWITYRPDLPQTQIQTLRKTIPDTYAVLSPYPGLDSPVVASAWGKQLKLTGADDPRLPAFIRAYRQGPQTPEPGAACTGGTNGTTAP